MMHKKQYEAIAAAIRSSKFLSDDMTAAVKYCAMSVASALEQVSGDPTFDRARFLKACGVEE